MKKRGKGIACCLQRVIVNWCDWIQNTDSNATCVKVFGQDTSFVDPIALPVVDFFNLLMNAHVCSVLGYIQWTGTRCPLLYGRYGHGEDRRERPPDMTRLASLRSEM